MNDNLVKSFQVGKTYATRSICDYDCIIAVTILARTAKTVKAEVHGKLKTFRLRDCGGFEAFSPWGSYSMAPTITADKLAD